jgi:crotonobetainyl-CoA:carnitine CoA-transferase CaiB-like acyl-CoA transferase
MSGLRPLDGVRVLEVGSSVSASFAARLLGDLGARVTRVEPRAGDPLRAQGPFMGGASRVSALFGYLNAGKDCIGADLASDAARAMLSDLVDHSDLVLWVADDAVVAHLRDLVDEARPQRPATVVLSPFGLKGARAGNAGSAYVAQHSGGFAYHQAYPVADPAATPPAGCADREADMVVGLVAANAALWALLAGAGDAAKPLVDLSAEDTFAYFLVDALADFKEGRLPPSRKRRPDQNITVAGGLIWFLPCADGAIMVSPREDHQWVRWTELMGSPAWARDPALCGSRATRTTHSAQLQVLMAQWSATQNAHDVFRKAQALRVACFPVSTPADLVRNEQLLARYFFDTLTTDGTGDVAMPGLPFRMLSSNGASLRRGARRSFPVLGTAAPRLEEKSAAARPAAATRSCLSGVRVVDFSWVVAGPMATKRLGAMGAEIIKIESASRPEFAYRDGWFAVINNNKRSSTLNITTPEGQDLIRKLVAGSDVVVENFSSRVLAKNHLAYEDLRKVKPDIIFVSASGLGRTGPEQDMLAYGSLLQAYSGRVSLIGSLNPGLEAMGIMPAWTDPVTSLWESLAIMAALRHRAVTGEGCYIDLSMLEATVALLPDAVLHSALGLKTQERGTESEIGAAPSGCFKCRGEDDWIAVSVRGDTEWQGLCRALQRPDLAGDADLRDRAGRLRRKRELNRILADWCAARTAPEAALRAEHVPSAPSRGIRDLLEDRHLQERDIFRQLDNGLWSIALPWMDETGWRGVLNPAPRLGADNDYVFGTLLKLPPQAQEKLKQAAVIA